MKRLAAILGNLGLVAILMAFALMLHSYYSVTLPMVELTEEGRMDEAHLKYDEGTKRGRLATNLAYVGVSIVVAGLALRYAASLRGKGSGVETPGGGEA